MPPYLPSIDEELTGLRARDKSSSLINHASSELELLRVHKNSCNSESCINEKEQHFPSACLQLLKSIPGNSNCVDCGAADPDWASVSYGALLCLKCSGRHRSFGVQVSFVRSLPMDSWSHSQVLSLLEGGNAQLSSFFERHSLCPDQSTSDNRYRTKAALFYRQKLSLHVQHVIANGCYQGREASRATSNSRHRIKCAQRRRKRNKEIPETIAA